MGKPTGVLIVEAPGQDTERLEWNGIPAERDKARQRFNELMKSRQYFAYVQTSPGRAQQVTTFSDVEKMEKELGIATVTVQPSLQGG